MVLFCASLLKFYEEYSFSELELMNKFRDELKSRFIGNEEEAVAISKELAAIANATDNLDRLVPNSFDQKSVEMIRRAIVGHYSELYSLVKLPINYQFPHLKEELGKLE